MSDTFNVQSAPDKQWRFIFIGLAALITILLPALSSAYGQTGDEWLQMLYGRDIWDYFFNNDTQALDYNTLLPRYQGMERQFLGQELYGGMFDFGTEILHRWFPSIPHLVLRHFCNALTNVLLIVSTGLIAKRLSNRWSTAVLALLLMLFSPRIFGEGMNNPKDIPFAAGFTLASYAAIAFLQDGKKALLRHALLMLLGFGLAFGVRAAGGLLFFAYLVVFFILWKFFDPASKSSWWQDKAARNKVLIFLACSIVGGYILGLLFWPWGLQSPVGHPLESLQGMTNRETKIRTLFEGRYMLNSNMPWYYEFKWIFISNPIAVIGGVILFAILGFTQRKKNGMFGFAAMLFAALFPLVYMVYKHSSVYDTWRHVFFVYPYWVIMAALGWQYLSVLIAGKMQKSGAIGGYIGHGIALLALIPAIAWTIRVHPNQYVYFNELAGGIKGAEGRYELDYYYNSSQQQVNWMLKNIPRVPGHKVVVMSNMGGFGPNCLHNDTSSLEPGYLSFSRMDTNPWEYYMLFPRLLPEGLVKNKSWLPSNASNVVRVDGVPLSAVIKRTDSLDIMAARAAANKDFQTAATYLQQLVAKAPNNYFAWLNYANALANLNRLPDCIKALEQVTKLNPEDIQAWSFMAQVQNAAGNAQAAQMAQNRAMELSSEEQEANGEE
jgi:hypothetical protein